METGSQGQHSRSGVTYYIIVDREENIWNGKHFWRGCPKLYPSPPNKVKEKVGLTYGLGPLKIKPVRLTDA